MNRSLGENVQYHRKEGNVLFNGALNTFYLRLYGVGHMVKDHSDSERGETLCRHMGYSFRLTARVLLYAQDCTYHGLCYTSRGTLAGTRNSSMGPPKDRSDDPHVRTLLPRSYISLCNHRCTMPMHGEGVGGGGGGVGGGNYYNCLKKFTMKFKRGLLIYIVHTYVNK